MDWTNPWGEYKYINDIEIREDGGTHGTLQAIRTALAIEVKTKMGTQNIRQREHELVGMAFEEFRKIDDLHILADNVENRLGFFSIYLDNVNFNFVVKLLNDKLGIQVKGDCARAGTYGHFLLDVSCNNSKEITNLTHHGDHLQRPVWIRTSLHPTTTQNEFDTLVRGVKRGFEKSQQLWQGLHIQPICQSIQASH